MKETSLYDDLLEGLTAMRQHLKGEKITAREETIERFEPLTINAEEIKEIRTSLNLSQSVFAHKLRTSVRTYQGWEQGKTKPNAQATLLLKLVEKEPQLFKQIASI